ncbi:MAG: hypothetical protein GXO18_05255 [Aquificae bacterium]|nr:hypothetical protein [Aquificota bacterium]
MGRVIFPLVIFIGVSLFIALRVFLHENVEKVFSLRAELWKGSRVRFGTFEGKKAEEIVKALEGLKKEGKPVWFGAPDLEVPCALEISNRKDRYRLCRGTDGRWYLSLPSSYKGSETTAYLAVPREKAEALIRELSEMLNER